MIITGGMNVYTTEVETSPPHAPVSGEWQSLNSTSSDWGEAVVAFVVPGRHRRVRSGEAVSDTAATNCPLQATQGNPRSRRIASDRVPQARQEGVACRLAWLVALLRHPRPHARKVDLSPMGGPTLDDGPARYCQAGLCSIDHIEASDQTSARAIERRTPDECAARFSGAIPRPVSHNAAGTCELHER